VSRSVTRGGSQSTKYLLGSGVAAGVLFLSGCGETADRYNVSNLGVPERDATAQAPGMWDLWLWSWVAAMAVGIIVWGLMFYAVIRYRRRSDNDIPVQTRYNLPLEFFYIVAPVVMCVVFFKWTLEVQDDVLRMDPEPDHTMTIVGQKWSFTFNHNEEAAVDGQTVYEVGTTGTAPTLYLPVDETTEFQLYSPDVIHSFWIPAFMMKLDIVPGRDNKFQVTPTKLGTYDGKCAELCGVYHSRMLFKVKVVSREEYDAYLRKLEAQGNVSEDGPVLGGELIGTVIGKESAEEEDGE
jgi:cytochrome c oxidase subunit II